MLDEAETLGEEPSPSDLVRLCAEEAPRLMLLEKEHSRGLEIARCLVQLLPGMVPAGDSSAQPCTVRRCQARSGGKPRRDRAPAMWGPQAERCEVCPVCLVCRARRRRARRDGGDSPPMKRQRKEMEGSSGQVALLRGALAQEQQRVQELEQERARREGWARREPWTGKTMLEAEVLRGRRWRMQLFRELRGCRQALQLERGRRHQRELATRRELRKTEYELQVARLETKSTQEALDTAIKLVHEQGTTLQLLARRLEGAEGAVAAALGELEGPEAACCDGDRLRAAVLVCQEREASSAALVRRMEGKLEVLRDSMPFVEQVLHERDAHGSGRVGMRVVEILKRVAS